MAAWYTWRTFGILNHVIMFNVFLYALIWSEGIYLLILLRPQIYNAFQFEVSKYNLQREKAILNITGVDQTFMAEWKYLTRWDHVSIRPSSIRRFFPPIMPRFYSDGSAHLLHTLFATRCTIFFVSIQLCFQREQFAEQTGRTSDDTCTCDWLYVSQFCHSSRHRKHQTLCRFKEDF